MSDFEKAARGAAREVWPNARIAGCNFHFTQALRRRANFNQILSRELRINNQAKFALKLFFRLSLIPKRFLSEGKPSIFELEHLSRLFSIDYPLIPFFWYRLGYRSLSIDFVYIFPLLFFLRMLSCKTIPLIHCHFLSIDGNI